MAKVNGTGQYGKSFQDRELAGNVRTLSLKKIEIVLKKGKGRLFEAILIKLAGTVLPRLNEHTGAEGKELPVPIFNVHTDNGNTKGSKPLK